MISKRTAEYIAANLTGDYDLVRAMAATDRATAHRERVVRGMSMGSVRHNGGRFVDGSVLTSGRVVLGYRRD